MNTLMTLNDANNINKKMWLILSSRGRLMELPKSFFYARSWALSGCWSPFFPLPQQLQTV